MKKLFLILPLVLILVGCGNKAVTSVEKSGNPMAAAVDIASTANLSDKCDKQAQAVFTLGGFEKQAGSSYEHHYSAKTSKCYVLITIDDKTSGQKIETLSEAFDGQALGSFTTINAVGGTTPMVCMMQDKPCTSQAEFDAFVKTYMEE